MEKITLKDLCGMNHTTNNSLRILRLENEELYNEVKDKEIEIIFDHECEKINEVVYKAFPDDIISEEIKEKYYHKIGFKELEFLLKLLEKPFYKVEDDVIYFLKD